MSVIEGDGFLSQEASDGKAHIIGKYNDFFEYSRELNRYCMSFLAKLPVEWTDRHKMVLNVLYMRTVESFQSVVLLLELGMESQAKIITRTMLEIMFNAVALQRKPELLTYYFNQHEESHFRGLKATLEFKGEALKKAVRAHKFEKMYIKKKEERKKALPEILSPKDWANKAELTDLYNVYYVTYSNAVHSNPSALDAHVDETGDDINLGFGPSDKDLYDVLKCCCYVIFNVLNSVALAHGQNLSNDIDSFLYRFKQFDDKYITGT